MPYKPTGNPPGRPRVKPAEPKTAAKPAVKETPVHPAPEAHLKPPAPGKETALHMAAGTLCAVCWPEGWPGKAVGLGCIHGSWIRRI